MQLNNEKIAKIIHKYQKMFEILEKYDRTREWPIGRARIDITLDKKIIKKLKKIKEKTRKSISHLIEEVIIDKYFSPKSFSTNPKRTLK